MSARQPVVSGKVLVRALERDGWSVVRQRGSHARLKKPGRRHALVVPPHKEVDAVRLLMGLGPTRLRVVYQEGWGQGCAGTLNVSTLIDKVKSDARKKADQDTEILVTAELEPNEPVVPDDSPGWNMSPTGKTSLKEEGSVGCASSI